MRELWYLATMNDGLFVINRKPQPAPVDFVNTSLESPEIVIPLPGNDRQTQTVAELLIAAHNTVTAESSWNKAAPIVDGVYWWRLSENDPDPDICETDLEHGFVYDIGDPMGVKISERGGEYLGPIAATTV